MEDRGWRIEDGGWRGAWGGDSVMGFGWSGGEEKIGPQQRDASAAISSNERGLTVQWGCMVLFSG